MPRPAWRPAILGSRLASLPAAHLLKDPKTRLQEALQARGLALPVYTPDRRHGRGA